MLCSPLSLEDIAHGGLCSKIVTSQHLVIALPGCMHNISVCSTKDARHSNVVLIQTLEYRELKNLWKAYIQNEEVRKALLVTTLKLLVEQRSKSGTRHSAMLSNGTIRKVLEDWALAGSLTMPPPYDRAPRLEAIHIAVPILSACNGVPNGHRMQLLF